MSSTSAQQELTAHYSSPSGQQAFAYPQSAISANATNKERTAYLGQLHKSVTELQGEVNAFLTKKMDEDKAAAQGSGTAVNSAKIDENMEEENYGEEMDGE